MPWGRPLPERPARPGDPPLFAKVRHGIPRPPHAGTLCHPAAGRLLRFPQLRQRTHRHQPAPGHRQRRRSPDAAGEEQQGRRQGPALLPGEGRAAARQRRSGRQPRGLAGGRPPGVRVGRVGEGRPGQVPERVRQLPGQRQGAPLRGLRLREGHADHPAGPQPPGRERLRRRAHRDQEDPRARGGDRRTARPGIPQARGGSREERHHRDPQGPAGLPAGNPRRPRGGRPEEQLPERLQPLPVRLRRTRRWARRAWPRRATAKPPSCAPIPRCWKRR